MRSSRKPGIAPVLIGGRLLPYRLRRDQEPRAEEGRRDHTPQHRGRRRVGDPGAEHHPHGRDQPHRRAKDEIYRAVEDVARDGEDYRRQRDGLGGAQDASAGARKSIRIGTSNTAPPVPVSAEPKPTRAPTASRAVAPKRRASCCAPSRLPSLGT